MIPDIAGRSVDETLVGTDSEDIVSQAKSRVAKELGWKGLFLHAMPTLSFAQLAVQGFNKAHGTQYDPPKSTDEFLRLGQDLGFLQMLPDTPG